MVIQVSYIKNVYISLPVFFSTSSSYFPFCFSRQSCSYPFTKCICIIPGNMNDWMIKPVKILVNKKNTKFLQRARTENISLWHRLPNNFRNIMICQMKTFEDRPDKKMLVIFLNRSTFLDNQ